MIVYTLDQDQLTKILALADPKNFQKGVDAALLRIGLEMQRESAQLAPYKTGNLRRSIVIGERSSTMVQVGTDLEYAAVHEFGGAEVNMPWIKERRYMRTAFENQQNGRAQSILEEEINRYLK